MVLELKGRNCLVSEVLLSWDVLCILFFTMLPPVIDDRFGYGMFLENMWVLYDTCDYFLNNLNYIYCYLLIV